LTRVGRETYNSLSMANDFPIVKKLQAELEGLDREYRFEIPRLIREATAQGDLSDNAEYQAAKQRQEFVQARIIHLKERLSGLSMVNLGGIPRDRAGFGSTVVLEDVDSGEEKTYFLVLPEEVDAAAGKISVRSPVGQAIVGRQEGDEVSIRTPAGERHYVVGTLRTLHDIDE
jgi:transcription elongation factor GreA